jgi:hypothetical protein
MLCFISRFMSNLFPPFFLSAKFFLFNGKFFFFNFLYLDILSAFKKRNIGILDSTCWKWGCNMHYFFYNQIKEWTYLMIAFAQKIFSCILLEIYLINMI